VSRTRRSCLTALAALVAVSGLAVAQERRHSRQFPPDKLGELEGPDRERWQQPDAIMDALGIHEGSSVADLGAGGGWFTVRLARRAGPDRRGYGQDGQEASI